MNEKDSFALENFLFTCNDPATLERENPNFWYYDVRRNDCNRSYMKSAPSSEKVDSQRVQGALKSWKIGRCKGSEIILHILYGEEN